MATIAFSKSTRPLPDPIVGNGVIHTFVWSEIGQSDDGGAVEINGNAVDFVVQAAGDFSGGATVALQGSNNGTNWTALNDMSGVAIALGEDEIAGVAVVPVLVRPVANSGDGSTDIDVTLIVRTAAI
jgi:hypothetical protein